MTRPKAKAFILLAAVLATSIVTLGMIPHTTCGCPQIEDGTQLTRAINAVWQTATGKRFFPKPANQSY